VDTEPLEPDNLARTIQSPIRKNPGGLCEIRGGAWRATEQSLFNRNGVGAEFGAEDVRSGLKVGNTEPAQGIGLNGWSRQAVSGSIQPPSPDFRARLGLAGGGIDHKPLKSGFFCTDDHREITHPDGCG
jgi:hypothetical protein